MGMRVSSTAVATATAAVVLAATGIATASIPDAAGDIHTCFKSGSGVVRVIDPSAGGACKSGSEAPLTWNRIAPRGPIGPQGSQGPTGQQGPKGTPGVDGDNAMTFDPQTMVVVGSVSAAQQIGGFFTSLTCPQGTKALWGGWEFSAFVGNKPPPFGESWPIGDDRWGFAVEASQQSVGSAAFVVLTCAIAR